MADQTLRGYVLPAGEGLAPGRSDLKASALSTSGALTIVQSQIDGGPPRHVHTHEDECLFVVSGLLVVECGDEVFEAAQHSFSFLPRGVPHTFRAAEGAATVLVIAVPGGIEDYFDEINQASDAAAQELIGERYGIRVV
jgi:mannose-6-phosphate isomerase-like protein (cupin superfamily)